MRQVMLKGASIMWYSKILMAYDGSKPSDRAVEIACDMARENPQAQIVFAHVLKLVGSTMGESGMNQILFEQARDIQRRLEEVAAPFGARARVLMLKGSSPATLLVSCCEEEDCDVIVMGSRGMGGVKGYLGSVSRSVVQEAKACVVVAKEQ